MTFEIGEGIFVNGETFTITHPITITTTGTAPGSVRWWPPAEPRFRYGDMVRAVPGRGRILMVVNQWPHDSNWDWECLDLQRIGEGTLGFRDIELEPLA